MPSETSPSGTVGDEAFTRGGLGVSFHPRSKRGPRMSHTANSIDPARRLWITAASAAGSVGIVATSVPFVASMSPSERARAFGAPVEVDVRSIRPGN